MVLAPCIAGIVKTVLQSSKKYLLLQIGYQTITLKGKPEQPLPARHIKIPYLNDSLTHAFMYGILSKTSAAITEPLGITSSISLINSAWDSWFLARLYSTKDNALAV